MKVTKCCRGLFKVLYFSMTFIGGWQYVLKDTNFTPPVMLGNGNEELVVGDYPFNEMPKHLKLYYIGSVSYYFQDLVVHLITTPNSDYFEMILHHLVAIELIVSSYLFGMWSIGIWVLMQMDLADIWIGLIRLCMDFANKYLVFGIYLLIMHSFIHFRFIAFFRLLLQGAPTSLRFAINDSPDMMSFNVILLTCLTTLNIWWFVLLLRMGYRFIAKRSTHDLQNVVSKKDIQN